MLSFSFTKVISFNMSGKKEIRATIKPLLLFGLIQDSRSEVLFCIHLFLIGKPRH